MRTLLVLVSAGLSATAARADVFGFTENPTGNFAAWSSFMASFGDTRVIDFDDHQVGPFDPGFYSASHGVTFQPSGSVGDVLFGEGPAQNDDTGPLSEGEGPHAASNYLEFGPGPAGLVATFDTPIFGAGMFLVDYFNPLGDNPVVISAYSGPDGTGDLLGSFVSAPYNFQPNNMYFMGIGSTDGDIRSLSIESTGGHGDIFGGEDFPHCIPAPGTAMPLLGVLAVWRRRGR